MDSTYEITDPGTDREALVYGSLRYSLDLTGDPQNSIGWVVESHGDPGYYTSDTCTVTEAASVPGAREYVIERTRAGIERAIEQAGEFGYDTEPIQTLKDELDEA